MSGTQVGFFEQLKTQHAAFCAQRDQVQINFQQLVGAIHTCEVLMNQYAQHLKDSLMEHVAATTRPEHTQGEEFIPEYIKEEVPVHEEAC